MSDFKHIPVFFDEAINYLEIKKDGIYVDCTFGRGGHSSKILNELSPNGKLIAIDRDKEAYEFFKRNFNDKRVIFANDKFSNIDKILSKNNISSVDGILYDLGVSSPQLDDISRGFSYSGDSLLDMRMDQRQEKNASDILKQYPREKLISIFKNYGEIYNCQKVVDEILKVRDNYENFSTQQFVEIIKKNIPKKELYKEKHPARKYFQALRIEVNSELYEIEESLKKSISFLSKNGRIVVISFHSLEDKIIKEIFKEKTMSSIPKEVLINDNQEYKIIKTIYKPTNNELERNNRSRSARIRCLMRV